MQSYVETYISCWIILLFLQLFLHIFSHRWGPSPLLYSVLNMQGKIQLKMCKSNEMCLSLLTAYTKSS